MSLGTIPFGSPTTSGATVTLDSWLKRPDVITRRTADLVRKGFIAGDVFDTSSIDRGSIVVEIPNAVDNDLFTATDVERIEPLGKYPRAETTRGTLTPFAAEKWGHEYEISEEAITDNDESQMTKAPQQLANTLVRKLDLRAVQVLEAGVSTYSRTVSSTTQWSAINALTYDTKTNASSALQVFAKANQQLATEERGFDDTFDTLLLNPQEAYNLFLSIGKGWKQALAETVGITKIKVSNRVPMGNGYYLASGQVGAMRFVWPLTVKPRDNEDNDGKILKARTRFIPYLNEPFALLKLTNLGPTS